LYVSNVKSGWKNDFRSPPGGRIRQAWKNSALAAFAVRKIQRADSGNPYKRQDSGEQDNYDQGESPGFGQTGATLSPSPKGLTYQ
jgi:hypothetical protein